VSPKTDPKHGRWILPLVVAAIVLFTYIFVNSLPPGSVPDSTTTTTTEATTTTTTSATTTTTVPDALAGFIADLDGYAASVATLLGDATTINQQWDDRTVGLSVIRDELTRIATESTTLLASVQAAVAPPLVADAWEGVVAAAQSLQAGADGMVSGLEAPDTGEARRAALADFQAAAAGFAESVTAVRTAAAG
jgi:uncharacterized phage infection (PIP) family protein YhgE